MIIRKGRRFLVAREAKMLNDFVVPATVGRINVAFWNLQNLFDTDISKLAADL